MKDRGRVLPAAIFFFACACLVFREQILNGNTACINDGDWKTGVWILCWLTHALTTNPLGLFDANILYPAKLSLCFSEYGPGLQLLFAPGYLLTGDPNLAFTIFGILGCTASSLSAYFVAWKWFGRHMIATVAGLCYGFSLLIELPHPVYWGAWWWPLCFYFFVRSMRMRSWQDALKCAVFLCLNGLTSIQFLMISLVLLSATAIFSINTKCPMIKNNRTKPIGALLHKRNPLIIGLAGVLLGLILTVPFYIPYAYLAWSHQIGPRPLPDYLLVNSDAIFSFYRLPGILVPLLLLGYIFAPKRMHTRLLSCIGVNAAITYILSKGPLLIVNGSPTFVPLPFCVFLLLPIFNCLRAPNRFILLGGFFFAIFAGLGIYAILAFIARRLKIEPVLKHPVTVFALACIILIPIDYSIQPLFALKIQPPSKIPPCYKWLAKAPDTTIVTEYPGDFAESETEDSNCNYMSCFHWHKIVNGDSSYSPLSYQPFTTREIDTLPCRSAFENLAALGATHVFVRQKHLSSRQQENFQNSISTFHYDTMGDDLIVPLANLRHELEARGRGSTQSPSVSIAAGNKLVLPAATDIRLALGARVSGAIWTNSRPNLSEKINVIWKRREGGSQNNSSTMECFLPPFVRNGVEGVAICTVSTPNLPGQYQLACLNPPPWMQAPEIPVDLVAPRAESSKTFVATPKARLLIAGQLEVTGAAGPARVQVRITNDGNVPILEETRIIFNPSKLLNEFMAGNIHRPADACYSAFVTGDVAEVRPEWIDARGQTCVVQTNENTRLIAPLYPGTKIEIPITMVAPPNPGKYKLRLHLELEKRRKSCPPGVSRTYPVDLAVVEQEAHL